MLYHVTPSKNVKSILTVGLEPRIGKASKKNDEKQLCVYLFTSLEWVKEGIETWLGEVYWNEDLSVLSINATAEELGGEVNSGEVLVNRLIPSAYIKELYPPEEVDDALGIEY